MCFVYNFFRLCYMPTFLSNLRLMRSLSNLIKASILINSHIQRERERERVFCFLSQAKLLYAKMDPTIAFNSWVECTGFCFILGSSLLTNAVLVRMDDHVWNTWLWLNGVQRACNKAFICFINRRIQRGPGSHDNHFYRPEKLWMHNR